jgi:broad specificity phosphatase PhoE
MLVYRNRLLREMRILITRHGESLYNIENRIGGDPPLSESGKAYTKRLAIFCQREKVPTVAYTSTKRRAVETIAGCQAIFSKCTYCPELDEIDAGVYEDLTYAEVKQKYPEQFYSRQADKLNYRYPEGESYRDLFKRVTPFVTKIVENGEDVFVVCHRAVTRALLYHLTSIPIADIPVFEVPLHHILQLSGNPGMMDLSILNID